MVVKDYTLLKHFIIKKITLTVSSHLCLYWDKSPLTLTCYLHSGITDCHISS